MFNIKKYQEIQDFIRKHQKISKIVAISKNHPKESVIEALKHGVRIFGENRVQEAKTKFVENPEISKSSGQYTYEISKFPARFQNIWKPHYLKKMRRRIRSWF